MATAGKFLQVTVNGVLLHKGVQKWSVDETGEELDDADAETNGYEATDVALLGAAISIEGVWDTADGPFPAVRKGMLLVNLSLFANRTQGTPDYNFPLARVMKRPRTVDVGGQIKYSIELHNYGIFYIDGVAAGV